MPERLPTGRFLVLSAAVHAAAFAVLGAVLVTPSGSEPPRRIEAALAIPPALEEPLPELESTADAVVPTGTEPAEGTELVEAAEAEVGDPRLASIEGGVPSSVPSPALIGVGGGGLRFRAPRAETASAPPDAPLVEAPPPAVPDLRARPVPGACAAPDYPARERRLGVEGVVELLVRVAADGAVASAEVAASSGTAALDEAALPAVRGWRFEPARSAGAAVPDEIVQRFRFRLVSAAISGR